MRTKTTPRPVRGKLSKSDRKRLEALIEEATVDCYDEDEQHAGFDAMLQDRVRYPFRARVLGEDVEVIGCEWSGSRSGIKAIVRHKGREYRYGILDLKWTDPPEGVEWIEAYRLWSKG